MGDFKKIRQKENRLKYRDLICFDPVTVFGSIINARLPKKIDPKPKPKKNKKKELAKYRKLVKQLTNEVNKQSIPGYNKLMIFDYYKHGKLCDNQDKLIIDHKIPVIHGFKNKIPPEIISHISNLQYISIEANRIKHFIPLVDKLNQWIMDLEY